MELVTDAAPFVAPVSAQTGMAALKDDFMREEHLLQPAKQPSTDLSSMARLGFKPDQYLPDNACSDSLTMDGQFFDAGAAYDGSRPTFLLPEDEDEEQQRDEQQRRQWQQQQQQQEREQEEDAMGLLDMEHAPSNDSTCLMEPLLMQLTGQDTFPTAAQAESQRQLYCLVRIDEVTGQPLRSATEEDAAELARLMSSSSDSGNDNDAVCSWPVMQKEGAAGGSNAQEGAGDGADEASKGADEPAGEVGSVGNGRVSTVGNAGAMEKAGMQDRAEAAAAAPAAKQPRTFHHKAGGPCDHCAAKDSPQWRRGPPNKPILCNACGTRYRRTNQLGPPIPSNGKAANRKRAAAGAPSDARKAPAKAAKRGAGAAVRK